MIKAPEDTGEEEAMVDREDTVEEAMVAVGEVARHATHAEGMATCLETAPRDKSATTVRYVRQSSCSFS